MSIAKFAIKEFEEAKNLREFVQACDSEGAYRGGLLEEALQGEKALSEHDEQRLAEAAQNDEVAKARDAAFKRLNLTQDEVDRESERQLDELE